MSIRQALALLGLLLLLTDDGFREWFFGALGFLLFWVWVFFCPVFLWALLVPKRADVTPGPGTWLLFGIWWAFCLYVMLLWAWR